MWHNKAGNYVEQHTVESFLHYGEMKILVEKLEVDANYLQLFEKTSQHTKLD